MLLLDFVMLLSFTMQLDASKVIRGFLDKEPCLVMLTLTYLNYRLYGSTFVVNFDKCAGSCNIIDD